MDKVLTVVGAVVITLAGYIAFRNATRQENKNTNSNEKFESSKPRS